MQWDAIASLFAIIRLVAELRALFGIHEQWSKKWKGLWKVIDKGTFEKRYDKIDTYEMASFFLNKILTRKEYRVVREIFIVRMFLDIYCFFMCLFYTFFHPLRSFLNITGLNFGLTLASRKL